MGRLEELETLRAGEELAQYEIGSAVAALMVGICKETPTRTAKAYLDLSQVSYECDHSNSEEPVPISPKSPENLRRREKRCRSDAKDAREERERTQPIFL